MKKAVSLLSVMVLLTVFLFSIHFFSASATLIQNDWNFTHPNSPTYDNAFNKVEKINSSLFPNYNYSYNISIAQDFPVAYQTKITDFENTEFRVQLVDENFNAITNYCERNMNFCFGFSKYPAGEVTATGNNDDYRMFNFRWDANPENHNTGHGIPGMITLVGFTIPNMNEGKNVTKAFTSTIENNGADGAMRHHTIKIVQAKNTLTGETHWYIDWNTVVLNSARVQAQGFGTVDDTYFQLDRFIENGLYFFIYNSFPSNTRYKIDVKIPTPPETTAPETTTEATVPQTTAPPETTAPETTTEATVPQTTAPPETTAPETTTETTAPTETPTLPPPPLVQNGWDFTHPENPDSRPDYISAEQADSTLEGYDSTWNLKVKQDFPALYQTKITNLVSSKIKIQLVSDDQFTPVTEYCSKNINLTFGFALDPKGQVKANGVSDRYRMFKVRKEQSEHGIWRPGVIRLSGFSIPGLYENDIVRFIYSETMDNMDGMNIGVAYAKNSVTGEYHYYITFNTVVLNSANVSTPTGSVDDTYFQVDEYVENGAYFFIYNSFPGNSNYKVSIYSEAGGPPEKPQTEKTVNGWKFADYEGKGNIDNNNAVKGTPVQGYATWDVTVEPGFTAVYTTKITDLQDAMIKIVRTDRFTGQDQFYIGFAEEPNAVGPPINYQTDRFKQFRLRQNMDTPDITWIALNTGTIIPGLASTTLNIDGVLVSSAGYYLSFMTDNGKWYLNFSGKIVKHPDSSKTEVNEYLCFDDYVENGAYFFIMNPHFEPRTYTISIQSAAVEPDEISEENPEPTPVELFLEKFNQNLEAIRNKDDAVLAELKADWDALSFSDQMSVEAELVDDDELWTLLTYIKEFDSYGENPKDPQDNDEDSPRTGETSFVFVAMLLFCLSTGWILNSARRTVK